MDKPNENHRIVVHYWFLFATASLSEWRWAAALLVLLVLPGLLVPVPVVCTFASFGRSKLGKGFGSLGSDRARHVQIVRGKKVRKKKVSNLFFLCISSLFSRSPQTSIIYNPAIHDSQQTHSKHIVCTVPYHPFPLSNKKYSTQHSHYYYTRFLLL